MAIPLKTVYVSLDGLAMRSKGIESFDWSDLLRAAPKRGRNRVIPGVNGSEARPRARGELRAAFSVRVSGNYTQTNVVIGPGRDAKLEQFYINLQALRAKTEQTTLIPISLVTPHATYTTDCQVEDGGTPTFLNPWTAELVVDVTVPAGTLVGS